MSALSVYHAFIHKLDDQVRASVENMRMNKRAGGGGNVEWSNVVALYRDVLAGILVSQPSAQPNPSQ